MNIRQLKIFKAVCEEESITKAAEKLFISQPAVSSTIIELEEYIGFDLFDRISRNIVLNEKGKLFLVEVNGLLNHYDDIHRSFVHIDEEARIKLGSSITLSMDSLPQVITEFKKEYPNTPIEVTIKNAEDIEEMVLNNELDFGLVEGVIRSQELSSIELSSYDLAIVCSPNYLDGQQKLDLDEFVTYDFLLREKGSAIRDVFDSTMLLNNKNIQPIWTSINSQSLLNATLNKIGITVLPRIIVEDYIKNKQLIELEVENVKLRNKNYIVYNKNRSRSKSIEHLTSLIIKFYE